MRKEFVGIFVCIAAAPTAASAQLGVEIGPIIGAYAPGGNYDHTAPYWRVGTPEHPGENRGVAFGLEARAWVNGRFGVQFQTVTSSVNHPTAYTPEGPFASSTRMSSVTAEAVYNFSPESSRNRLWVAAGGGAIRHSGSAYAPYGSPTNPVGSLGVGSTLNFAKTLRASVGVNTLLYHWNLSDANGTYQRGFEHDILAHGGITWDLF
ncbi:MAG: hypothetical protein ABR582_05575 [Gemmatimonadaceae bacterium]